MTPPQKKGKKSETLYLLSLDKKLILAILEKKTCRTIGVRAARVHSWVAMNTKLSKQVKYNTYEFRLDLRKGKKSF